MTITYYSDERVTLYLGNCLEVLPSLPDASVDAVVTDPPYGLSALPQAQVVRTVAAWLAGDRAHVPAGRGFHGASWDAFVPPPAVWDECWRVLKPGGHLLSFSGARTVDLLGLSIRLAGFEVRDSIHWIYGSGLPKSTDISGAVEHTVTSALGGPVAAARLRSRRRRGAAAKVGAGDELLDQVAALAAAEARRWSGWATTLKPAHEPIVLARRPLDTATVAQNTVVHGVGALNVAGCRIAAAPGTPPPGQAPGRWPANIVLSHPPLLDDCGYPVGDACEEQCVPHCPVAEIDRQSGHRVSRRTVRDHNGSTFFHFAPRGATAMGYDDEGGASRYFPVFRYGAKAPTAQRARLRDGTEMTTVKPLDLMRWLVRLVAQPGGVILDPFAGSGSTLLAAVAEGQRSIGVERHAAHAALCRTRLAHPLQRIPQQQQRNGT
jgi:DNA modification methylase